MALRVSIPLAQSQRILSRKKIWQSKNRGGICQREAWKFVRSDRQNTLEKRNTRVRLDFFSTQFLDGKTGRKFSYGECGQEERYRIHAGGDVAGTNAGFWKLIEGGAPQDSQSVASEGRRGTAGFAHGDDAAGLDLLRDARQGELTYPQPNVWANVPWPAHRCHGGTENKALCVQENDCRQGRHNWLPSQEKNWAIADASLARVQKFIGVMETSV